MEPIIWVCRRCNLWIRLKETEPWCIILDQMVIEKVRYHDGLSTLGMGFRYAAALTAPSWFDQQILIASHVSGLFLIDATTGKENVAI